MSQSKSPAAAPSAFVQIRFEEVAEAMPDLMTSLFEATDKQAARAWAVRYGEMMRKLTSLAGPADIVLEDEGDVQGLLVEARNRLITFATSEWLELAPDLVRGLERRLHRLAPGVSIGDKLPPPCTSTSQLVVPVPATSQSSAASSPVVALPMSTMPSASSGNTGPLTQGRTWFDPFLAWLGSKSNEEFRWQEGEV
ncbi:hypothetical protein F5888DRAFT_1808693 [Russula emetica]|nr:hypothetical protein F5888DRAFT_1808693 [Russula emetica]